MATGAGQRQNKPRVGARNAAPEEGQKKGLAVSNKPIAVITGANGFVGSALASAFADRGWHIRAGVRRPGEYTGPGETFDCELPRTLNAAAFADARVVIHAAWAMRLRDRRQAMTTNLGGSRRVIEAARQAGARLIFVSSCSAHKRSQSLYGQGKLAVEQLLDPQSDLVIRPGLVVGPGGLFARMVESVRRTPVIPLIDGGRQPVQTIAVEELCEGVLRAIERDLRGRLVLAHPQGIASGAMMGLIAQQLNRRRLFLPIGSAPFLMAARAAEGLGFTLPITSENLLGLRSMIRQRSDEDLKKLGLELERPVVVLRKGVRSISRTHRVAAKDKQSTDE